jgi:hypothetical protein
MLSEEVAVGVEEISVRGFQNPRVLSGVGFAGVDLVAFGMDGKEELFAGRGLELRGGLLGLDGREDEKKDSREHQKRAKTETADHAESPPRTRGRRRAEEYNPNKKKE